LKFSIGDKVLLKQTGEEGHVSAYINTLMLEVEVNGVTFPVHLDDIDHPYLKWFTDKPAKKKKAPLPEQLPVEKIAERKQRLAKGVYLSFLPVFKTEEMEEVVDVLKVYLLNEMPQPVKFLYDVRFSQESEFRHEGVLHAFGNVYLHSIGYPDMNDQPRFHWQLADTQNTAMETADGILRIRPAKLFEHISDLLLHSKPTFSYLLTDDFKPKKKPEPKEKFEPSSKLRSKPLITAKTIEPAKYEIDLHIEQLVDNKKGLTNADIVKLQLDTLQHYLHLAIVHRQERMIVIHGLGKGKLREEVHTVLRQTPEVSRFKNEWSGRYGFGATEVFFRY
jgi:Smr domain-containing protein